MIAEELKNKLLAFFEKCEGFYGRSLQIQEDISINKLEFDRHYTTKSFSKFVLERVGYRISGGHVMFEGEGLYYEINPGLVTHFEEQPGEFEFIETYAETIFRRTKIKLA